MPVTARLSQRFYEKLGDELTTELVNWFNDVDATYRADLRELNELNFARFDAKLEQRMSGIDTHFAQLETRFERVEARFEQMDGRFAQLEALLRALIEQRAAEQDARWERRIAALEVRMEKGFAEQTKWMFLFWVGNAATTAGIVFAALRFA